MEEERRQQGPKDKGSAGSQGAMGDEIAQEINRLADALGHAARSAWSSEQRHQLEAELRRGMAALMENVEEALAKFNRSEQGQELRGQAEKVAERVRHSGLAADLTDGLAKGLQMAATEVQKFADNLEEQQARPDKAQDIPVQQGDDARNTRED